MLTASVSIAPGYHFYIVSHPDRHSGQEGVNFLSNPPDQPVDLDTALERIRTWVRDRHDYIGVLVDTQTGRYQVFGARGLPDLKEIPLLTEEDISFYEALTAGCLSGRITQLS